MFHRLHERETGARTAIRFEIVNARVTRDRPAADAANELPVERGTFASARRGARASSASTAAEVAETRFYDRALLPLDEPFDGPPRLPPSTRRPSCRRMAGRCGPLGNLLAREGSAHDLSVRSRVTDHVRR